MGNEHHLPAMHIIVEMIYIITYLILSVCESRMNLPRFDRPNHAKNGNYP